MQQQPMNPQQQSFDRLEQLLIKQAEMQSKLTDDLRTC